MFDPGGACTWGQIGIVAIIAALALAAEHYFPWRLALGRDLPRPGAYVLGVLAMAIPLSGLYVAWGFEPPAWQLAHLAALWAVVGAGGLTVLAAYGLDWTIRRVRLAAELAELRRMRDDG